MRFNNRGFTLIEIMIAMLLLSFLMISVILMTNNSFDVKDRTLVQDENNLKIYTALQRIEWDISHAYSPLYYEKIMEPTDLAIKKIASTPAAPEDEPAADPSLQASRQIFETLKQRISSNRNFKELSVTALPVPNFELKSKDDFIFYTIGNRRKFSDSKESFYAWVRYRLEDQEASEEDTPAELQGLKRLVRYFVPQDPFSLAEIDYDKVKPFTLMRNVKALKFEFWSNKNEKFVDSLKESGEPFVFRAVKITITWLDDFAAEQEIEHIMTPLYPFFDLERDIQERAASNPNTTTANNNNNNNSNSAAGGNENNSSGGSTTTGSSSGGTP